MAKKCCADNNFNENIHGLKCHCIHSCCVMQYHITVQDDDGGDYYYMIICASNQTCSLYIPVFVTCISVLVAM